MAHVRCLMSNVWDSSIFSLLPLIFFLRFVINICWSFLSLFFLAISLNIRWRFRLIFVSDLSQYLLENFIWEASLASRISINLGSIIPTPQSWKPPAVEILANLDKSASLTVFCDLSVWLKSQDVFWWELIPPITETCLKARYWFPNSGNLLQFSWILQFWDLPFLKKTSPQTKRHQPSLLITFLAISTSLTFITK